MTRGQDMKWIRISHRIIPLDVELPAARGSLWLHGMRNLLAGGDTDGVVGSSASTGGRNGRNLLVGGGGMTDGVDFIGARSRLFLEPEARAASKTVLDDFLLVVLLRVLVSSKSRRYSSMLRNTTSEIC